MFNISECFFFIPKSKRSFGCNFSEKDAQLCPYLNNLITLEYYQETMTLVLLICTLKIRSLVFTYVSNYSNYIIFNTVGHIKGLL